MKMKPKTDAIMVTVAQMVAAEKRTMKAGTSGWQLMRRAGKAVAETIIAHYPKQNVLVLCGPGNNGGDGFVIAELLRRAGWEVEVVCLVETKKLKGDAASAAEFYEGKSHYFDLAILQEKTLIIDALFGTGLEREIKGETKRIIEAVNQSGKTVVAVDIPSGIHGDTGQIMGIAIKAKRTITFAAKKPAHLMLPGREHCGVVSVADIGITLPEPNLYENGPALWYEQLPIPKPEQHKYSRGTALICGAPITMTGATRLAAEATARSGAGATTVACNTQSLMTYAGHFTSIMMRLLEEENWASMVADKRYTALLVGPGGGVNDFTYQCVFDTMATGKPTVLDADALTCFNRIPQELFDICHENIVLTPHEGEFKRLFEIEGDKLTRARAAAKMSGAVVLLKGADTVIASPDGRLAINSNAPATLATVGAGDVLSGIITGLLAGGMPAYEAACAGVWIHGQAASKLGMGMIAEDLLKVIPKVWKRLVR